jgi:hypothetical protein
MMKDRKATIMEGVITFFVGWFLVSIPSSLLIGAFLARRNASATAPTPTYASRYAAMLETSEMRAI